MKRTLSISTILALVLVLALSVTAMAAGPGTNAANANPGNGYGDGVYGDFVDVDSDGVCDNYRSALQSQDGTGNRWGSLDSGQAGQRFNGQQAPMGGGNGNFIDENGDGICDLGPEGCPNMQDGSQQMRRGGRWNR